MANDISLEEFEKLTTEEKQCVLDRWKQGCENLPYVLFAPKWAMDIVRDKIGTDSVRQASMEHLLSQFFCGIIRLVAIYDEETFHRKVMAALMMLLGNVEAMDSSTITVDTPFDDMPCIEDKGNGSDTVH